MKSMKLGVMGALLLGAATGAQAQFAKPEDAIKYRQSAMFLMGTTAERIVRDSPCSVLAVKPASVQSVSG